MTEDMNFNEENGWLRGFRHGFAAGAGGIVLSLGVSWMLFS
jgi:hypothetical protein